MIAPPAGVYLCTVIRATGETICGIAPCQLGRSKLVARRTTRRRNLSVLFIVSMRWREVANRPAAEGEVR